MLDGKWVIGNPETEVGGLESVERGPAGVPSYPWRYYSDGVWAVDQLLTVTGKYYKTKENFWEQENHHGTKFLSSNFQQKVHNLYHLSSKGMLKSRF